MTNRYKTGLIRLVNFNNHDRIEPLLKIFLVLFILLFVGTVFNKKILLLGAGFIVLIYTFIIAIWIRGKI